MAIDSLNKLCKWRMVLAGWHIVPGAPLDTTALRKELLEAHLDAVRQLIPVNAAIIHGQS